MQNNNMSGALGSVLNKLSKYKRLSMYEGRPTIGSYNQVAHHKPKGLWYSCGTSWMKWLLSEQPDWVKPYIYSISISGNVLKISNKRELVEFTKKYILEGHIPGMSTSLFIDWPKVAKEYDGIEICPYIYECRYSSETEWYYTWDVASGCLWSQSALAGHELVAYFNKGKYVLKGDKDFSPIEHIKTARIVIRYIEKLNNCPGNKF